MTTHIFRTPPIVHVIRAEEHGGKTWFAGEDVSQALGYLKPFKAVQDTCNPEGTRDKHTFKSEGGIQTISMIDADNVKLLIDRSEAPWAESFEAWFFGEALGVIRNKPR